jgi:hypothetical protein
MIELEKSDAYLSLEKFFQDLLRTLKARLGIVWYRKPHVCAHVQTNQYSFLEMSR